MSKNSQTQKTQKTKVLKTAFFKVVLKSVLICAIIGAVIGLGIMIASRFGVSFPFAGEPSLTTYTAADVQTDETLSDIDLGGVTFNFTTATYNGTYHTASVSGNLPEGVSVAYINNSHKDAGTYTAIAVFSGEGYNDAYLTCEMVIAKAQIPDTVTFDDKTFKYDGTAHSVTVSGLPTGVSVKYVGNTVTLLGTYEVTAILYGDNYETKALTATLTVEKNQITGITLEDGIFLYNGESHRLNYEGTLPEGVEAIWEKEDRTAVGEHEVKLTLEGYGYETQVLTATIRVQKGTLQGQFGVMFPDITREYKYKEETKIEYLSKSALPIPEGIDITYTYNGTTQAVPFSFTNAGEYAVTVSFVDTLGRYEDLTLSMTLVIEKADIEATFSSATYTYGNGTYYMIARRSGDFGDVKVTYTYNGVTQDAPFEFTDAGKYEVTATFTGENYNTREITSTLTIEQASLKGYIAFNDADYTYKNGYERRLAVDTLQELPEKVVVSYTYGKTTQSENFSFEDAGEYTVTVTLSGNNNYEAFKITATLVIEKADASYYVYAKSNQKFTSSSEGAFPEYEVYDDVPGAPTDIKVTFYYNGEVLTEGFTAPGEYEVTMIAEGANYYCEEEITVTVSYNPVIILYAILIGAAVGLVIGILISIIGASSDKFSQRHFLLPRTGIVNARGDILCESRAKCKTNKKSGRLYLTANTVEFYAEDYRNAENNFLINISDIRNIEVVSDSKIIIHANHQEFVFTVPAGKSDEWRYQIVKA